MKKRYWIIITGVVFLFLILISLGNKDNDEIQISVDRLTKIPSDAVKMSPLSDDSKPFSNSDEYEHPVPLSEIINSAGAEDSPFIPADEDSLYFFFTPDVRIPAEKQLLDGVTGIYVSKKINGQFQKPERILLQKKSKLALDGCEFVFNKVMLFCSAREGYTGINWFSALFNEKSEKWEFDKQVEFPKEYEVGELHEVNDKIYYHSSRVGGKGGLDIWVTKRNSDGTWTQPENIEGVNSPGDEGWPYVTPDESEIWFHKDYGIWKSKKVNGEWQESELIISNLAGEPTLDKEGNVYFVHHFYKNNTMIEADIYVARKKA